MKIFDLLFILIWIFIPVLWQFILRIGGMSIFKISLPSFLVSAIIVFQYIGYPILFFKLDILRRDEVTDETLIITSWLLTSITTTLLCIGSVFGRLVLGRIIYFKKIKINYTKENKIITYRLNIISFLCISILYLYVLKIGTNNIALFNVFDSSLNELSIARSQMGNAFDGKYHWYHLIMREIFMFVTLALIAQKFLYGVNLLNSINIFIFTNLIFSLIMATEKGWLMNYVILIYLLYVIIRHNGKVMINHIFIVLILLCLLLIPMYIFFMKDLGFSFVITSIFSRAFTGSIQPLYHYLEVFPKYHDWLYGASFPNPGGIFPYVPFNIAVEVLNLVQPWNLNSGIVGSMPAMYWGELYANFELILLFIIPPIIGLFLYIINWLIFKIKFDALSAAYFAWMLMHYRDLSITSVSGFIFDINALGVTLTFLLIKLNFFRSILK
jgi:hypothetical protein